MLRADRRTRLALFFLSALALACTLQSLTASLPLSDEEASAETAPTAVRSNVRASRRNVGWTY